MNKKILIAGAAVLVLLLGVGGFLLFVKKNVEKQEVVMQPQQKQETEMQGANPVKDLFAKALQGNSSIKCTYTNESGTGTFYVKNGMMRMETQVAGKNASMIFKKPYVYSWQEGSTQGMKMDTSQTAPTGTQQKQYTSPEDVQANLDKYRPNCSEESVADSMFELPSNVTFSDLSETMKNVMQKMPSGVMIPHVTGMPENGTSQ